MQHGVRSERRLESRCGSAGGQEGEGVDVTWSDHGEMASIRGGDVCQVPAFGCGDYRGVSSSQWQVSVFRDEFGDAEPIRRVDGLDHEQTLGQVSEEAHLGFGSESAGDEVCGFGDDEGRDDEGAAVCLEQFEAGFVVCIVGVDVGVQRSGVDDQGAYRSHSRLRISSIRADTSERPLRPAAAAPNRRRAPVGAQRYWVIASRVSSATVIPRRAASWRRRSSSSSGSFTVVRFMVCQHTCEC